MEKEKFVITLTVIVAILAGFFAGTSYTMNYYNLTVTQTSVITVPYTKIVTTTIVTTVMAQTQSVQAAPVLNTVFAYKSNVYVVSSSGTIVSVFLPNSYVNYAGEIANFYSWFNPQYIKFVASKYSMSYHYPMPSGDQSNYLQFSHFATRVFSYDQARAQTIYMNPQTMMPLSVLNSREGICGDYMHFWALLEIAENRSVTLVDMFPVDKKVGHAFIVDDQGYVIENNGHVIFNTSAAYILWYNYFDEPLSLTFFLANPTDGITSISTTLIKNVPLVMPKSVIQGTYYVKGVYNGSGYTATVVYNYTGTGGTIISYVTQANLSYSKTIIIQGNIAIVITSNVLGATSTGYPFDSNFSYADLLPDFMKYRNIVDYNEMNNTKYYTLFLSDNETLYATSFENTIIATEFLQSNGSVYAVLTYSANLLYS